MELRQLEQPRSIDWKTIVISSLSTLIVTVIGSFIFYYYTQEKPELKYEIFPVTSFISNQNAISIINVQIRNSGKKEVEEVISKFEFDTNIVIRDIDINPSSNAITYSTHSDSIKSVIQYQFATLNPDEYCNFSFLLSSRTDSISTKDLKVALRAKGINGLADKTVNLTKGNEQSDLFYHVLLLLLTFLLTILAALLVIAGKIRTPRITYSRSFEILSLGVNYCDTGLFDESIAVLKAGIYEFPEKAPLHANLARAYANKKNFNNANIEIQVAEILAKNEEEKFINDYINAQIYSLSGNQDKALEYLSKAYKTSPDTTRSKAVIDNEFIELRQNPDFNTRLASSIRDNRKSF